MSNDFIKAVAFAAEKHKNQRRKDAHASPYINHPIALANVLANEGGWLTWIRSTFKWKLEAEIGSELLNLFLDSNEVSLIFQQNPRFKPD